jgi:Leucine-rich repeat (LRR) protein
MDLNPDYIKKNLDQIGKRAARDILKEWIVNSDNIGLRETALNLYSSMDEGKEFKFFEQLFLSDESFKIRSLSGNILQDNYFYHKKFVSLLEFTLNDVNNMDQKSFAVETLNSIDTKKARKIIKDYLKKAIKLSFKKKAYEFPEEIFNSNYDTPIPNSILEVCFNLILYDYYVNSCGYNVTLRKGLIILLNCEGGKLNDISEIQALNKLVKLEHLQLQRNNIQNIHSLSHLTQLKTLNLSQNQIKKIENLDGLNNLQEISLSSNKIKKIENLDLGNLKKLSLDRNLITEIENFDNLRDLELLNLSYNAILKLKNLENLSNLRTLFLSFNQIETISGLEKLENLVSLHINDNRITHIQGLKRLLSLKVLSLSNNCIERIENLENLVELNKLEISNNKILSLSGLNNLSNLQELFIDKNRIKGLEGITNLKSLIILFLENNHIKEFNMSYVANLKNLNFIFLNENPLTPESWEIYQKRTRFP